MDVLPCGHVALRDPRRLCVHLWGEQGEEETVALLSGVGLDHDLCCRACDRRRAAGEMIELLDSCEGCVARVAEDLTNPTAWRGEPGLRHRPEPVDLTLRQTPLPDSLRDPVDLVSWESRPGSWWLVLTRDHHLVALDAGSGRTEVVGLVRLPTEGAAAGDRRRPRPRLRCALDGRFAAVAHDHGRHGVVIDLESGRQTMALDRGPGHVEQTAFPVTFWLHGGRTLLIHATAWNRLDVSDPADGSLLTARAPTAYDAGQRPEHYLDYFHGALHLSPDQRWMVDDGWVWSPVGIPTVVDVGRWMDNVWETEDGPSLTQLGFRGYLWNVPVCWLGDGLVTVSGIGTDAEAMLAGVCVFDPDSGSEVARFAGPSGELFAEGNRLFSVGSDGLRIWDPLTGSQTGSVPGFQPVAHHRGAHELAGIAGSTLLRWRTTRCA